MKRFVKHVVTIATAALISSAAFGFDNYFENFEALDAENPDALTNEGWLVFGNVFGGFPACDQGYWYGYGPFPAPNGGAAFSNIVVDTNTGQALNVFSDYNNGNHADNACIEASVFQERIFSAADAGSFTFRFYTTVPMELDDGVNVYGFIKLLDPDNGFSLDEFKTVLTDTAGWKEVEIILDESADGKILQWGFTSVASNYLPSGRWYDYISFTPTSDVPTVTYVDPGLAVPIPFWAMLLMAGVLAYFGGSRLVARKQS